MNEAYLRLRFSERYDPIIPSDGPERNIMRYTTPSLQTNARPYIRTLLAVALVASILSSSYLLSSHLGNAIAVGLFGLVLLLYPKLYSEIVLYREIMLSLIIIYLVMIANILIPVVTEGTLQSGWYVVPPVLAVSIVSFIIIPSMFDIKYVVYVINRLAAAVILIGLPSLAIGAHRFLWITIEPYADFELFGFVGPEVPAIVSIYPDTNAASKIAMIGLFLAVYEYRIQGGYVAASLLSINTLGVYFTHSRGVFLAVLCGAVIYVTMKWRGETATVAVFYAIACSMVVTFFVVVQPPPIPSMTVDIELSGRGAAWRAATAAFLNNTLLGMGFGESAKNIAPYFKEEFKLLSPQNSYLRMFVTTGIVGGLSYIFLIVRSVRYGIHRHTQSDVPPEVVALCVALVVLQLFENFSLFGVNQSSVIASTMFGYLVASTTGGESSPTKTPANRTD